MKKSGRRICIDVRCLETGSRYRGYGYYVKSLIANVLKEDKENSYVLIAYGENNPLVPLAKRHEVFYMKPPKMRPRFWWIHDQLELPRVIRKINPDIFVSLDTNMPLLTAKSKISTIAAVHDLVPLILKDEYRLPIDRKIDFNLKLVAAKRAKAILTISKHSKKDIEGYLKTSADRVKYIYESTDDSFSPASSLEVGRLRKKYASGKKYVMTVGDYYGSDPRKNYLFLIDSFAEFAKSGKGKDIILLLVGQSGGKNNEFSRIKERAMTKGILSRVKFTGFVSDKALSGLYTGSEAFLYPTKYEGFGLPILQAMSCGCPVVAADNTSIPEVAGAGGELFKTGDQKSFIKALDKVLQNRDKYRKSGFENIKRFSWNKSAKEFIGFLNNL